MCYSFINSSFLNINSTSEFLIEFSPRTKEQEKKRSFPDMTKKTEDVEVRNAAAAAKCRAEHAFGPKLSGWEFYKSIGSPKYIVAPMVLFSLVLLLALLFVSLPCALFQ